MAAGMARGGLRPFVAIYSTFMQRAFDQVIHDVALMNLPVVFCIDRAGLVGEDGPTHHGAFDVSFLRVIPNLQMLAPADETELRLMLKYAATCAGPVVIRYPRGSSGGRTEPEKARPEIVAGHAELISDGDQISVWALGHALSEATIAIRELKDSGISAQLINPRFIRPFDVELLAETVRRNLPIVTVEENALPGGFGSLLAEHALELGHTAGILRIGLPDNFVQHGSQDELRSLLKIDAAGIREKILNWLKTRHRP